LEVKRIFEKFWVKKGLDRLRILCEPALRGVRSIFCLGREVAEPEGQAKEAYFVKAMHI
jgi:hypothetical protein